MKRPRPQPRFCPVLFRPGFIVKLGPIPRPVQDQIYFMAFEYRAQGKTLGYLMVDAWTRFRYRHNRILSLLCDFGLVYTSEHNGHTCHEWKSIQPAMPLRSARPQRSEDGRSAGQRAFFEANPKAGFFVGRVVAPRISLMHETPPLFSGADSCQYSLPPLFRLGASRGSLTDETIG